MEKRFGIKNVVGGFDSGISLEEQIPYVLARTALEHRQLREIFYRVTPFHKGDVLDFGTGYGRNLPLLSEFFRRVYAIERDPELAELAYCLYSPFHYGVGRVDTFSKLSIFSNSVFDVVFSYTVLQHLEEIEVIQAAEEIKRVLRPDGYVFLVEETDPAHFSEAKGDRHSTYPRSEERYASLFGRLEYTEKRVKTSGSSSSGGMVMVFRSLKPS